MNIDFTVKQLTIMRCIVCFRCIDRGWCIEAGIWRSQDPGLPVYNPARDPIQV